MIFRIKIHLAGEAAWLVFRQWTDRSLCAEGRWVSSQAFSAPRIGPQALPTPTCWSRSPSGHLRVVGTEGTESRP